MLLGSRADGLIVVAFGAEEPQLYQDLQRQHVPFVLIDRHFPEFECPCVLTDDRRAGLLCAQHLIDLATARSDSSQARTSAFRATVAGYEEALRGRAS
ncbi:MAG: hypothetical protein R2748_32885 [Bryobacterales bacterium]